MPGRVNGFSLAYTAIGGVVLWSGIKGTSLSATFKGLLSGQAPGTDTEPISDALTATAAVLSTSSLTDTAAGSSSEAQQAAGLAPSGSATYTGTGLQSLWTSNGGAKDTAAIAAAIGQAESSGNAAVTSANPNGGTNVGIWQLDTTGVGSGYSVAELQNANTNARVTIMATRNGVDWTDWGDPVADALPGHQYTPGAAVPG
jgi:hypothetical protein